MANWAALVDVLAVAGSRLSDGTPNASGTVWFMRPGTNTEVNAYSDAAATTVITQPVTLTAGGTINRTSYPNGIYVTQPVRLLVQDVNGTTVVDTVYIPATAGDVGVSNAGFTDSTLDAVLTTLYTSTGGQDGTYLESGGATERTIKEKFAEIWISVKDFGAVGDGVAIDTTAVQAAMNRVKALGGGVCYFPPGTYLIDQALTLTAADGVSLVGTGPDASIITSSNASANCFTIASCDSFQARGLTLTHATTSTGTAFALDTCNAPTFENIVHEGANNSGWLVALSLAASPSCTVTNCTLEGESTSANGRGISVATNSGNLTVVGGRLEAIAGYAVAVDGNSGTFLFVGVTIATTFRYAATASGSPFVFVGCSITTLSIGTATMPEIKLLGSTPRGSATAGATGAAQTPSLIAGYNVELAATSGGAGTVTVNAPAVLPSNITGQYWDFTFINAAGGAVTWSLNAVYVVASAIPTTAAHTINVRFMWDPNAAKLREVSRADTVT